MSLNSSNVPVIAITPDESPNNNYDNYDHNNIEEVATDVEDIYFQTEKRKKKTKKHLLKKDPYATDVEDLEGSDDDLSSPLIKHTSPISLSEVLENDIPTINENYKTGDTSIKNRSKLRTQTSVTSSTQYLQPDKTELNQMLTDLEDFNDSDDEDEISEKESDTDLLKEIIHDSGTVSISDSVKKFLQAVPSPMVTPVHNISDDEKDHKGSQKKRLLPKNIHKQIPNVLLISSNLNELTDTEILEYDSNDERQKCKYVKIRRQTLPRKIKLDLTDTEDLELSENEQSKHRRVTVADLPKSNTHQQKFGVSQNSLIPQITNDGDSDTEGIQFFNQKNRGKLSKQLLKINKEENNINTDVEDIDGDSDEDFEDRENKNDDYAYEFEDEGIIEEKYMSKKSNKDHKIEKPYIHTRKDGDNSYSSENETDEEENYDDSELNESEMNKKNDDMKNITLKFVHRNKKNNLKKENCKPNLNVPNIDNETVFTDVENLDSSDDDKNEIPLTVINTNLNNGNTDTESIEGELDNKIYDLADDFLPTCSRNMVYVKVDKNNTSHIFSTKLQDVDTGEENINEMETDNEEISGDEILESDSEEKEYDLNVLDDDCTQYKDTLKLPIKYNEDAEETDIEDIDNIKPNRSKITKRYLHVIEDDPDKNTDIEELDLSDTENVKRFSTLQVEDNLSTGKTDVEDFDASDNEQENTIPEYSRTPDALRQMGGETICSKEGIGRFTKHDRKKLNEKHDSINVAPTSPSPTNTDEFLASAEDEIYSRAETATPLQMTRELEEASSFKVHSQSNKKLDLEADEEVMYLKGGGFVLDSFTDSEEVGVSEEEYFLANDNSDDVLVNKACFNFGGNFNQELNMSAMMKTVGMISKLRFLSYKSKLNIDFTLRSTCRMLDSMCVKPKLFAIKLNHNLLEYTTELFIKRFPVFPTYYNMFYINYYKTIELKSMYCSSVDCDEINYNNFKSSRSQSLANAQLTKSLFGKANLEKIPHFLRIRSGSVTKLIIHYEHPSEIARKNSNVEFSLLEGNKFKQREENSSKRTCVKMYVGEMLYKGRKNIVKEKAQHFEKLLKSTRMKTVLNNKEWSPTKETSTQAKPPQEPVTASDAAQQDSGEGCTGNQRTLGASCSKLKLPQSPKPAVIITSYTHLDKLLDHMLAEVDEQERLVKLEHPQKLLKPVCVNSLKLIPSTDAVIEIPASHFQSPKVFETKHEIILNTNGNNDISDLDDEISLSTLNKSQDTESLFSFESISETYFLENLSNKYKASSESLNDLESLQILPNSEDDHIYEIVEPKDNYLCNQKPNDEDIWWEGTYRDLSIVPEEDEDNVSDISQCINRYKNIIDHKYEISKLFPSKQFNSDDCDNVSHHSSSDVSQTTGDEYDTSDVEHNISLNKPVKAEVKLLVKTLDRGKEDVEIRTVREFAEQINNENSEILTHTFPRKIKTSKPSFTLQRLFVRCPETSGFFNPITKELSKSNPELVATSNVQYPLHYDPNLQSPEYFKNVTNPNKIDLYANTPFYPCYGSYMKTENVNLSSNEPQTFPTAYCDWLLQPDEPNGGITTSPTQLVNNEVHESKIVTGESIIHDVLSKDIKPVLDQTRTFIRMESQSENVNVCSDGISPSQTKIKSPDLPDKASKELDNKKEKSKSSKGFFSSLKSLVGRSLDSSDSESKEEKTPKKKKKEKGTPKKSKKSSKDKQSQETVAPKSVSPKAEKKTKALYESQELDNIPSIDEIDSNGLQVTDLDADPITTDDVKTKATVLVDNVINDSKKAASKLLEGKIQEFNLEGTVTPEEVRRSTEPIIINEDEFLVVIENNDYEDIQSSDTKITQSPKKVIKKITREKSAEKSDDEGKSDSLKRKSVGFLKLFGKKDSKESDDESRADDHKQIIPKIEIDKPEDQHRKSSGFFGLFSKKPKEEELIIEEKVKQDTGKISDEKIEFSKKVQQQMIESADFLLKEVQFFEDVRPVYATKDHETKKIIKPSESEAKQSGIITGSEDIQQQIIDSADFLMKEVVFFEDVRPQKIVKEELVIKEQATSADAGNLAISEEIQQQMLDTANFLLNEVENFEDVRPVLNLQHKESANTKTEEKSEKSKVIIISDEVQQQMVETANFLFTEVEYFNDVKPRLPVTPVTVQTDEIKLPVSVENSALKETEIKSSEKIQKQDSDDQSDSKPGFFSKLGEKFTGKNVDKKEDTKENKRKKKKEKKPGFFSKIGERLSGTLSDEEKDIKDKVEKKPIKIENKIKIQNKLKSFESDASDTEESIKNKATDIGESITAAKDKTTDKIQDSVDKTKVLLNDFGEKLESGVKDVKECAVIPKIKADDMIKETVTDTKDLTNAVFTDITVSVKKTASDTKDIIDYSKDKVRIFITDTDDIIKEKTKDTKDGVKAIVLDVKDAAKEDIKNVEDKIKDSKETIVSAKDSSVNKVKEQSREVCDVVKSTVEKTEAIVIDIKDKIKEADKDAKDNATEKITERITDTKVAEKTSGFFSGLGKKLKGTAKDTSDTTKESAEKAADTLKDTGDKIKKTAKDFKESTTEKVKDTTESGKDAVKEAVEKSEVAINIAGPKIMQSTEDVKVTIVSAKDSTVEKLKEASDKTAVVFSNVKDKTEETAEDVKDSIVSAKAKVKETSENIKEKGKEAAEKSGGFFSGLGKKFKGAVKDTKEEIETKASDAKETVTDNTNKVGDKIKDSTKDAIDSATSAKDNAVEKVKDAAQTTKVTVKGVAIKTSNTASDVKDKIEEAAKDTKDSAVFAKVTAGHKIKDASESAKDIVKEAVCKTSDTASDVKDKIEKAAKDTKDSVVFAKVTAGHKIKHASESAKDIVKEAAGKTSDTASDVKDKIEETAKDTKDSAVFAKVTAGHKIKDASESAKDIVKEAAGKTSDTASDVKDKIEETAKDTKDSAVFAKVTAGHKIKDASESAKDIVKEAVCKTSDTASDVKDKIEKATKDTKDSVVFAKVTAGHKIKHASESAKDIVKEAAGKTSDTASDVKDKIEEAAKDTKDSVVFAKVTAGHKIEGTAETTKDTVKGAAYKTSTTASDVKDKIEEAAQDIEDSVIFAKVTAGHKIKDTAETAKDTVKGAADKTSTTASNVKDEIGEAAKDTKDSVVFAKVTAVYKIKDAAESAEDIVKEAADKTSDTTSDVKDKIKEATHDIEDSVVFAKVTAGHKIKGPVESAKDIVKEAADKTSTTASDVKDKIEETAQDIEDSVVFAKVTTVHKVKDTSESAKDIVKGATEKTGAAVNDVMDQIEITAVSAKDIAAEKVKETSNNIKDKREEVAEKTGGFFSGLGKKIKGVVTDTKDEAAVKISDTKETVKDTAKNAKDSVISAKDTTIEKIKDAAEITKDTVTEAVGKTSSAASNVKDKVKDATEDVKVSIDSSAKIVKVKGKDVTEKTDDVLDAVKDTARSVKNSTVETSKDVKDTGNEAAKNVGRFFSSLETKLKDTVQDTKEEIEIKSSSVQETASEVGDSVAEKTSIAASESKAKIKEVVKDVKDTTFSLTDSAVEKVNGATEITKDTIEGAAKQTATSASDAGDKVKETAKDIRDVAVSVKDSAEKKSKETVEEVKDKGKVAAEKTGGFFSGLGKKIKGTVKETKEEIDVKASDVKDAAKGASEKSVELLGDVKDKVYESATDAKNTVLSTKKSTTEKVKESSENIKEKGKEYTEKSEGFFSGLGKKFKGAKDDVGTKISDAKETVKDTVESAKDTAKGAADENSTVKVKITETTKDAKDLVVSAKDIAVDKINNTADSTKHTVEGTAGKTGAVVIEVKDKIKQTTKDTIDSVDSAKYSTVEKIKDTIETAEDSAKCVAEKTSTAATDAKDKVKEGSEIAKDSIKSTAEETGGFFSGLGKIFKSAVTEAKEEVADKVSDATDSTKDKIADIEDSTKQVVEKTGINVKEKSKIAKESAISAKDTVVEKVEDTATDVKEKTKEATVKVDGFFSGLRKEITDIGNETKKEISTDVSKAKETTKDTLSDVKKSSVENIQESSSKAVEKTSGFLFGLTSAFKDAKDNVEKAAQDTKEKTETHQHEIKDKLKESTKEAKGTVISAKDTAVEKVKVATENGKDVAKKGAEKTSNAINEAGEKINETVQDAKDSVILLTDSGKERTKEIAETTGGFFSELGKKFEGTAKDTKEEVQDKISGAKDTFTSVEDKIKDTTNEAKTTATEKVKDVSAGVKEVVHEVSENTRVLVSSKIKDVAEDIKDSTIVAKDSVAEKADIFISDYGDNIKKTADDTKETTVSVKDSVTKKSEETVSDVVKEAAEKAGEFFSGLGKKISDTGKETKDEISAKVSEARDIVCADKFEKGLSETGTKIKHTADTSEKLNDTFSGVKHALKENAKDTKDTVKDNVIEAGEKTSGFFNDLSQKFRDNIDESVDKTVKTTKEAKEKVKVTISETKDTSKKAEDKVGEVFSELGQKVTVKVSEIKDDGIDILKSEEMKLDTSTIDSTQTLKDTKEKFKDDVQKIDETFNTTKDKTLDAVKDLLDKKKSDFVCYVTTPTMQRKGIGGSQRLSKDERPALIDVSNMPIDVSSDEDEYIVTEPGDRMEMSLETGGSSRGSPLIIETVIEQEEQEFISDDDKRRPLFRIGSRDEESIDWGNKSEKTDIHSKDKEKSDTMTAQTDAQKDIDLIENKLAELGKALDDLEKVNIELEPQESGSDEKNERKLRRVERRFERMASETMEKDIKEAKDQQMTSPEVEAKREEDFRTIVSQLSQEEVSECQRLYSTLWDDVTFTPSEEWDSKTPDSQPDDIQDLPQGEVVEVVYMAPVTLNKDHLINKAGIEVDVIPIKRSPCTSPLPKKKLQNKGRARSAMGFYKEKQIEEVERGSLPDLQSAGKTNDPKLDIQKGSIMSAILKFNPNILKEKSPSDSTSSLYFNAFGSDQFGRRKSTDSLTKGTVVSAVKEWMAKSTPFSSTDNVRSTDAISLADTTISIFDDDDNDNDSVDMYSDSACQLESESSRSDANVPDIHIFSDCNVPTLSLLDTLKYHDVRIPATSHMRRVVHTLDQFTIGETSGGPLTKITTEGSTHLINFDKSSELTPDVPKPKPRTDITPDTSKTVTQQLTQESSEAETKVSEVVAEDIAYVDRKKFWETVSAPKKDEEKTEISIKKRMSLYEDQIYKQSESLIAKKRTSVHEIAIVPPVPKPRSTLTQISTEESSETTEEIQEEVKDPVVEKTELVSEYKASFKDPTLIINVKQTETKKAESVDSETEYLKFEHQAYENLGYLSDEQEIEQKLSGKLDTIPQIKRRQMSISQPPVAAARKTIFERSVSLPTEDLQDVSETSVKARKQFFEQQLKKEMVIDQLMTQLEEEELPEHKTLTSTDELHKIITPEEKLKIETIITSVKESERDIERDAREIEKKLSPISSSSSQDTRTEDDITQYTPTSVKDLTRYFQPSLLNEFAKIPKDKTELEKVDIEIYDKFEDSILRQEISDEEGIENDKDEKEISMKLKQSSTESEQSISSERSIELGSADELPSQIAEVLQYKSDSISKPSDSLEVHVDKSEIEDSEKGTDIEQDGTDVEVKSLGAEEYLSDAAETEVKIEKEETIEKIKELIFESKDEDKTHNEEELEIKEQIPQKVSPIREPKEGISDTIWEVSVQSQALTEIVESVTEIPIERQIIVEKDEELSGSVRDESDLGSEIHQDHSESYESERARSESHSEVEQLILESLYHQKINPEDARKIASELIEDIEAEIERRNLLSLLESDDSEPPAPHPEVARNQISDYLRQLAESKGLDAKEVELVESVLARKQNELSKLGRHDTQTSSMEITDEDLKYSGGECDMSPSDSHENILEEQIEHLEHESKLVELKEKSSIDEEKFSEKLSDIKTQKIHIQQDREIYADDAVLSLKTETTGKVKTTSHDEKESVKKAEQLIEEDQTIIKDIDEQSAIKSDKEQIELQTEIKLQSDTSIHTESINTKVDEDEQEEFSGKSISEKKVTDTSETEELTIDEATKKSVCLEGTRDAVVETHEEIEGGFQDTLTLQKTEVHGKEDDKIENKLEHKQETVITDDGTTIISQETKEERHSTTVKTSQFVDHKIEEKTSVTTFIQELTDEPITTIYEDVKQIQSDESKSSPYESAKSPEDQVSSSSSIRKDDSDTSNAFDRPEVVLRKTKFYKEVDTSSSSGNLKTDRRSGADFEAYSSSGESHYHSFEQDSGKSRPCSSDVEGLMAAGSSEYESALTSQDVSSRSHITSTEYHTAVSSLSSQSMKSLDSESSGHMASVEVSEASETLVPSTFELEGDILDGAVSQLLEDEVVDASPNGIIEPYDREIPEHIIRGDFPMKDKKSSFDTISDSDIHGESMDISEEDSTQDKPVVSEVASKMKRSQEMTFQPVPKAIIADSPQSETALEMDERFGSSLEDGSVLSMSLSSQSDVAALRTVIEMSRRDSDKQDGSVTISGQDSMSASNTSLDKIQPLTTVTDSSTSTGAHPQETVSSVTLTTSIVDEDGTQSVSTQVTSQAAAPIDEVYNGPTQVDYVPEYDDIIETKKIRGHRRQESTSSFVPSMISGFSSRTEVFKTAEYLVTENEKHTTSELTLKEEHHEEMKDVDETEESCETETDQEFYKQQTEAGILETESDQEERGSRFHSRENITKSEDQKNISDKPESDLLDLIKSDEEDIHHDSIERPTTPKSSEDFEFKSSVPTTPKNFSDEKQEVLYEKQFKMSISEKSSIEEGEAEAAFSMVAHISPAHKAKGDICPILEDEDAEKHELETRERAQKDMEKRRAQIIREQSPGSIPDIMVTEHMTPLVDREFHYPDLELEEKEALAQTPASVSSKSSEDTDQGREYILEESQQAISEEPELEELAEDTQVAETKSDVSHSTTVEEKTIYETEARETASATESPNSDSFEMLEKPDIIDDFVVIEEVAKEAAEHDTEGKSVEIKPIKYIRKHDEEVEEYLVKSAPTPLTRMTELKYYPDGSGSEEGPFDFEDSPPQAGKKSTGTKTTDVSSRTFGYEYDRELEASKRWIEMQFQGDQAALLNTGYGYEMDFERGPLEDIKEEEATDFESSRIGSLDSQKQSVGSIGSVKDSFSSTPEYDVLAGRKFFTRSGEHDDVSMSSLQEFEHLERVISLENRRHHQGSQDSSSNGSFSKRYQASRSGQGDDLSLSSLKEFEGLETACIEAHKIEVKAEEEEALLTQIDEAQENLISESESCKSTSSTDKKNVPESEEEDYEKRMFEIDEIIKQAQSNVEKFIDMKDLVDKTESMGRGDSLEEVAKVPDLELDEPLVKSTVQTVKWGNDDVMQTSTDSLDLKPSHHESTDSLDMKAGAVDLMTASTDSIEYQLQAKLDKGMVQSDSIEIQDPDKSCMITSDSLELTPGTLANIAQMSDSIDEDGSRIGEPIAHDQSSSSGFSIKDEQIESMEIKDQRADYLLGSTDSLDPSSSTATHATYQYETDSVMSSSFTSGGSNTMVSSTDTIDPFSGQAHGVDISTAVRKVWFDDDTFGAGSHFTTELLEEGSKPFVTEVIEPCEEDPEYSHTIHRKVELPPEIKKITFKGPNADLQLRQYIENFGEGEDVQESQEVDKDGNVHIKRVVQKRFIVKSDPSGEEKRISGPELESYLQQVSSQGAEEFDPTEFGLTKQTRNDSDGTKHIYGQKFSTKYTEGQGEESSLKQLLSAIASDVTESSTLSEYKITRHVDTQQESAGSATATFSGAAAASILRAQGSRRKPLRFDISVDDQTEVDPREHDWRFILPQHDEQTPDEKPDSSDSKQTTSQQRDVPDQHQLSSEMKELLEEMEKHAKQ